MSDLVTSLPNTVEANVAYVLALMSLTLTINAASNLTLPIFDVQGLVFVHLRLLAKENFSSGLKCRRASSAERV